MESKAPGPSPRKSTRPAGVGGRAGTGGVIDLVAVHSEPWPTTTGLAHTTLVAVVR